MQIKHVHVFRYGPLPAFQRQLGGFTLVHGPNERGKTLLLDAIFRLLFKLRGKSSTIYNMKFHLIRFL